MGIEPIPSSFRDRCSAWELQNLYLIGGGTENRTQNCDVQDHYFSRLNYTPVELYEGLEPSSSHYKSEILPLK